MLKSKVKIFKNLLKSKVKIFKNLPKSRVKIKSSNFLGGLQKFLPLF